MKNRILFAVLLFSAVIPLLSFAQSIPAKEDNSLRIMSYNVHNCIGMDNKMDYQRIANVITSVNPDVVALQELDSVTQRNKGIFALKEVANQALMHYTYAPAISFQGGKYGIGILSKEKPLNFRIIPLPGKEEQRTFLIAEFEKYIFCCTHLSLTEKDRDTSASIILNSVKQYAKPLFLAGDMNTEHDSKTQKILSEKFTILNDYKVNTFPSIKPDSCIDFIYGYNNGDKYSLLQRRVIDEEIASDHRPLFVDVRLKANESQIIKTKPYLQNPTNNGITVSWLSNVPTHSWVEYGTDKSLGNKAETLVDGQVISNNRHHKIRLTDLKPGATYYYRTCSREITLYEAYKKDFGKTAYSEVYSFTMPSPDNQNFTAIIFNDLHKKKELIDALMGQLKDVKYDFVVFNGDFVDDPKNEDVAVDFLSYMNEKAGVESVPAFYLRGNHEIRNAYSIQMRDLFDYVGNKTYGSFNWGDTRIVMLDCGEDKPDSTPVYYNLNNFEQLRKDQIGFLKQETTSEEFKKANKRILIHHIPIYGSGDKYNPCLDLWHPILKDAPFNVAINGHTHSFAYHPKGELKNNFPVVIGGGNRMETCTVMILKKEGSKMTLNVLNSEGKHLLDLDLSK